MVSARLGSFEQQKGGPSAKNGDSTNKNVDLTKIVVQWDTVVKNGGIMGFI
jgi:hypothetical protein